MSLDLETFDGVVLPGGAVGTANLGAHEGVVSTIKNLQKKESWLQQFVQPQVC